jgi:hypothetical protein
MRQRLSLVWLAVFGVMVVLVLAHRFSRKPAEQSSTPDVERSFSNASTPGTNTVSPPPSGQTSAGAAPSAKAVKSAPTPAPAAPPPAPVSLAPDFSDPPPATVMENMRSTFHLFASKFGGNPVGTNLEITQALNGGNPTRTRFIRPEDGLRINDAGELIDPWGTPFFFHQLSGKEMEIHSAGPDRVMWTADDLVTK